MHPALRVVAASIVILGTGAPARAQTGGAPAAPAPLPVPAGSPSIALGDLNVIRFPAGTTSGSRKVLLTFGNVPAGLSVKTPPTIQDTALEGHATVTFADPPQTVDDGSSPTWIFTVSVTGLPFVATESHEASVAIGGRTYSRAYSLTNRPAGTAAWSVAPPGVPWIVSWGAADSPLTLNVSAQDAPIESLMIAQSTLRDAQNLTQIDRDDLDLISDPIDGFSVPAHTARPFDIRLKRNGAGAHGKFTGTVQLAARNMPDQQSAAVTLYVSSIWMRALGALLIWIGLTISEQLVHRIRPRIARAQALRPVIAVRNAADDLLAELLGLVVGGVTFAVTQARLGGVKAALKTDQLDIDNLLPKAIDVPLGAAVDATAKLQERLTAAGVELTAIATLIRHGFRPAIADLANPAYAAATVKQALASLDGLGATVASATDALATIPPILDTYRQATGGARAAAAVAAQAATADPVTLEQANAIVEHESRAGWAIVKAVTLFTGVMLLVLPNAGFAWLDLGYCLAWGLGLPTAGAAFQSLTPTGVSTSLGVSVPR